MVASEFLFVPTADFKEVQAGLLTKIYVFFGRIRTSIGAFNPQHVFSMQGSSPDAAQIQRTASGGRDVRLINVADNSLTAGTDTLTVNGTVFTFVAGAPVGNQIQIGATAGDTETNITAAIDALAGIDAVIDTGQVKVTGPTNAFLVITTSIPAKVVITNGTDIDASLVLQFEGDSFVADTEQIAAIPLTVNGKPDVIFVVPLTPVVSGTTGRAQLTSRVKDLLDKALAGTTPTTGTGFVYSLLGATYAQISAALQTAFGATPATAFVISGTNSNILTLNLLGSDFTGYAGNFFYMRFGIFASAPKLKFTFGKNGEPILEGVGPGELLGSSRDYTRGASPATTVIPQDTALVDFGTVLTGLADAGSFTLNQVNNAFLQRLASGAAAYAVDDKFNYVMQGGALEYWGLVAVTQSGRVRGQFNLDVVPEALFTGGLQKNLAKAAADGLPVAFTAQAADAADATGYSAIFRQVAQV